jgi:predicted Ser/Thr protein kinase
LTENELKNYGTRTPAGFTKIDILGKGGAAVVYLCEKEKGDFYAVKQFPKKSSKSWIHEVNAQEKIMSTFQ